MRCHTSARLTDFYDKRYCVGELSQGDEQDGSELQLYRLQIQ